MKRDDLTGFALGGNKGRKLEYMLADALSQQAEVVVTCGATQSNFIRQLAAACAIFGLTCAAAVMELPFEYEALPPVLSRFGGNAYLDQLLGVDVRVHPNGTWEHLYELTEALAREYEAKGKRVYRIPIGGSSPLGAYAFLHAALELQAQTEPFDWIVTASSSGSTQTGLTYGFHETHTKVLGFVSDPEPEIVHDFVDLAAGLSKLLGEDPKLSASDFLIDTSFVGDGYGVPSPEGNEAIRWLARKEGLFLDPIYSGKAFSGLIAKVREGAIQGRVLFWHTGGVPSLFTLPESLAAKV